MQEAGQARTSSVKPALLAFVVLCLSFVVATFMEDATQRFAGKIMPGFVFALLQGIFASIIAFMFRMAWWWRFILCFFPLCVVIVNEWHVPPWIFLAVFLIMMLLFWTTFRSQVPYYPSRLTTWQAVSGLLPPEKSFAMVDIGSGFGGAMRYLSEFHPNGMFTGIEIAPLPWFISVVRARLSGSRARFVRGSYKSLKLREFDVVFAYLSPAAMPALWIQARKQMTKGSLLLSYEFEIPGVKPDLQIRVGGGKEILYGWYM